MQHWGMKEWIPGSCSALRKMMCCVLLSIESEECFVLLVVGAPRYVTIPWKFGRERR